MVSSLFEDVSDTFFFAMVLFLQIFNGKAVIRGNLFRILNNLMTQRLCELLFVVKDTNLLLIQN